MTQSDTPETRRQIAASRGATIPSPFEDGVEVVLKANTPIGIAFTHPNLGVCGLRYDSMTDAEYNRIAASR